MSFGVQGVTGSQQPDGSSPATGLRRFANLNLSEDQRTQIRAILKNAKSQGLAPSAVQSQINAILTPAQQQTLQADVQKAQAAHSGHHHHHGGGGSASSANSATGVNGLTEADVQNQAAAAAAIARPGR